MVTDTRMHDFRLSDRPLWELAQVHRCVKSLELWQDVTEAGPGADVGPESLRRDYKSVCMYIYICIYK